MCKVTKATQDSVQLNEPMSGSSDKQVNLVLRKLARPEKRIPSLNSSMVEQNHSKKKKTKNITCNSQETSNKYDVYKMVILAIRLSFIIVGLFFVMLDVTTFQLSTSNGRFVSFLDSFENCFAFRVQQPFQPIDENRKPLSHKTHRKSSYHIGNPVRSIKWKLRALILSFMFKYASSTLVSLMLRTKPVFLKGPRHLVYFTLALVLIQFFPTDLPFNTVRNSWWTQLMIALGTSFYKVRKLFFVVHVFDGNFTISGWLCMLVLSILAIDGNALARTFENLLTHRGVRTNCTRTFKQDVILGLIYFWERNVGLLICASSLFITNGVCNMQAESSSLSSSYQYTMMSSIACDVHLISKFGALLVFMERKNIWRARAGKSLLWKITNLEHMKID